MTALRVRMHGVAIALDALSDESALAPLLAHFDAAGDEPAALRVTVSEGGGREDLSAPQWQPRFFFGVMQGYVGPRGYALCDGRSQAVIDVDARRVEITLRRVRDGAFAATTSGLCHASLCLALREWGLFELHAAAVCDERATWLIVGNSGSGKSSLALAFLSDSARYLGDDRVLLAREHGATAVVRAYPRIFHVALATASAMPALLSLSERADGIGGKLALDPQRAFGGRFIAQGDGAAVILLPTVARADRTQVTRVNAAHALGALIESSALALVDGVRFRNENLAILASLANGASAFSVALGRDALIAPREVVAMIRSAVNA